MNKLINRNPSKPHLITGAGISIWMLILNIAAHSLGIKSWPMFFVTIFYFLGGAKHSMIPNIFAGGAFGLLLGVLFHSAVLAMIPLFGEKLSVYIPLGIILFVVILGGNICPVLCNNYAFAYYTIACISFSELGWINWLKQMAVLIAGGGIALSVSILIKTGVEKKYNLNNYDIVGKGKTDV